MYIKKILIAFLLLIALAGMAGCRRNISVNEPEKQKPESTEETGRVETSITTEPLGKFEANFETMATITEATNPKSTSWSLESTDEIFPNTDCEIATPEIEVVAPQETNSPNYAEMTDSTNSAEWGSATADD